MPAFDPYHEWLGIPPKDQPPHAYRLLAVELFESNPKVIEAAAEQRTMLLRSRASGPNSDATQKLLNEVQRARLLLLDDLKRAKYDAELREKLASAGSASSKSLPRAQALPETAAVVPLEPATPSVVVTDPARRAAAPPPSNSTTMIVAAVVGVMLLGGLLFWFMRPGETKPDPLAQKPPELKPAPIPPPPKPEPKPSPFVPVPADVPAPPKPEVKPEVKPQPPVTPPDMLPEPPPTPVEPPPAPVEPEPMPAEPPKDERRPKPLPAAQEKPLQSFREIFKDDLAKAKKPDQWQALTTRILEVAAESKDDPATQFVLLDQARQLSAAAGLWETSEQAIAALAETYQVDGAALRIESMEKAFDGPIDAAGRKKLAAVGLALFDTLLARQELDQAVQLSKVLAEPVKATRDKDLTAGLAARKKRGGEMFQARTRVTAARAALKAKPDDPEANLELGKSLLILGRPWVEVVAHLAAGSDPGWKAAAAKELAKPQDFAAQVELADAWWDLSERAETDIKPLVARRAGAWYQRAQPEATGIVKAKIERRLAALPEGAGDLDDPATSVAADTGPGRPAAKLIKEIYLDELPEEFARVYYGTLGGFGWADESKTHPILIGGKQPEHTLMMCPAGDNELRGPGVVQYDLGGVFTTFAGSVGLNERPDIYQPGSPVTFTVLGDNKVLWTSEPVGRKGDVQKFSISVRGVQHLRLEAISAGPANSCHAIWSMPKLSGGTKPLLTIPDRLAAGPRPTYLDDLVPVDWHTGHNGNLGVLGATAYPGDFAPYFTLQGRRVFHAVGTHARPDGPAYARYHLEGQFRSLKGTAALQEVRPGQPDFEGTLQFRIAGDGKLLWQSKPFKHLGETETFSVSLAGIKDLELSVQSDRPGHGWAGWLEPQLEWAKKPAPPAADASITADEAVIWNTHNGAGGDRGAMTGNLLLYQGSDLVAQVPAVRVGWAREKSVATRVPLPKKAFNRLRLEVTAGTVYHGAGLSEIELLHRGKNLAGAAIATASDNYSSSSGQGLCAASMINDGITQVPTQGPGYWMLPDQNCGWIELEWRKTDPAAKPHPALGYSLAKHPATAIPFGDHWYLYFPGRITWDEAQRRCQAMGGYLACVETEPEGRFTDAMARRQSVWLGGKRNPAGQWTWINGAEFRPARWIPGEPSDSGGGENLLEIINGKQWNDASEGSGSNRGYLCEWEQ